MKSIALFLLFLFLPKPKAAVTTENSGRLESATVNLSQYFDKFNIVDETDNGFEVGDPLNAPDDRQSDGEAVNPSTWKGIDLALLEHSNSERNLTKAEFDYAAQAGANIIRLAIFSDTKFHRFEVFYDANGALLPVDKSPGMAELKEAIGFAQADNMKVIIDMHQMEGETNGEIWDKVEFWDKMKEFWQLIATTYKGNSTVVAFDLMNEPNIVANPKVDQLSKNEMFAGTWSPPSEWRETASDYNFQISKLIRAIREIDPERYLIVEGFGFLGNPVNYSWMSPFTEFKKMIYSFHMYIPTNLTNIGSQDFVRRNLHGEAFDLSRDMQKIDKSLEPVLRFQKRYNVPIYVGEFGITSDAIFNSDESGKPYNGACWLTTIIKKFDQYKWGWTYWDFFSEVRRPKSVTDPRFIILSAAMKGQPMPEYCK